jgi:enamine deaminase RidA (YjgF/YER057c/UK114 family)
MSGSADQAAAAPRDDRQIIVPGPMMELHRRFGYAPAVGVGRFVFCAGQVGRSDALEIIADPERQFRACWRNLELVLAEAGCTLESVVDLVSYHVDMHAHFDLFKMVKNEIFPRGLAAWTAIGASALSRPGLLVELKAVAIRGEETAT